MTDASHQAAPTLSQEEKERIISLIRAKNAPRACPMCASNAWAIADGYFNQAIQSDFKVMRLGSHSIPSIAIICNNCGFIGQHALGVLGLLTQSITPDSTGSDSGTPKS